ncbi:MAG TPA: cyanophycinase [Thermoanaerobaculia bacterium]|jgi:cyanophycinase|nr:cyanophycinase [Thermoanaerobaculia bacterium]
MSKKGDGNGKQGRLIIIGGHEEKDGENSILRQVAERVGNGKLVVATVGSQEPEEMWKDYKKAFGDLGVKRLEHLHVETREEARDEKNAKVLDGATVVFFTGGDQLRITSQLGDSLIYQKLHDMYDRGGTIAGTSAGASVMSGTMLVAGGQEGSPKLGDLIRMAPGFDMIHDVIIDQHFAERGRIGRLVAAVSQNPAHLGIGIDEDTAILVEGEDDFRVIGKGAVYVVDGAGTSYSNVAEEKEDQTLAVHDLKLHLLSHGSCFNLKNRRPVEAEQPAEIEVER